MSYFGETMIAEIWDRMPITMRLNTVAECGWTTRKGKVSATGNRIADQQWASLSRAAKNVILSKLESGAETK